MCLRRRYRPQWTSRADAAILHVSPPWSALLTGTGADAAVCGLHLDPVDFYRSRGLAVVVTLDATDGLDRSAEAPELVSLGRSITEPAVQQVYRQYAVALATILAPDFPFVQALAVSSYPYLGGFADPEGVPLDYYARLAEGRPLPLLVVEGGWPSETVGAAESSPEEQARWIDRQVALLDAAGAEAAFSSPSPTWTSRLAGRRASRRSRDSAWWMPRSVQSQRWRGGTRRLPVCDSDSA